MLSLKGIYELLGAAVSDGGLTSRSYVEAEARTSDELQFTFPAYAALATWGREGLDLIVKIAIDGHTVKSKSAALTLLTMLATSGQLSDCGTVMIDSAFAAFVNGRIDAATMKPAAQQALRVLIM